MFCDMKMVRSCQGTISPFVEEVISLLQMVGISLVTMVELMSSFITGTVTVNDEPWLVRTLSVASGTRVAEFREACRQRDRGCVITGERAVSVRDSWAGFEAAHIFPLAYESYWIQQNFGRWISIHPRTGGSINSVQNGILLDSTIHSLFDNYDVSINPDVCVLLLP